MDLLRAYAGTLAPAVPVEHLHNIQYCKSLLHIQQEVRNNLRPPEAYPLEALLGASAAPIVALEADPKDYIANKAMRTTSLRQRSWKGREGRAVNPTGGRLTTPSYLWPDASRGPCIMSWVKSRPGPLMSLCVLGDCPTSPADALLGHKTAYFRTRPRQ